MKKIRQSPKLKKLIEYTLNPNDARKNLEDYYNGEEAPFKIILKGVSGNSRTYKDYDSILVLMDSEKSEFVNPVSKWTCRVIRNKNGIITEIIFTKK